MLVEISLAFSVVFQAALYKVSQQRLLICIQAIMFNLNTILFQDCLLFKFFLFLLQNFLCNGCLIKFRPQSLIDLILCLILNY
jgi:hypothetical protein